MSTKSSIFISYRRDDSRESALILFKELTDVFGYDSVFYDRNCIQGGDEWNKELENGVSNSKVVLVLIKDKLKWLGETRKGQNERITYEIDKFDDWVKKEITLARTYEKKIIPVLINGAVLPTEDDLPESLKFIPGIQTTNPIRTDYWDNDIQTLLKEIESTGIDRVTEQPKSPDLMSNKPTLQPYHKYTCNRSTQYGIFTGVLANPSRPRCHFYYLYGGEGQEPNGVFNRFVLRAKGIDLDYMNTEIKPDKNVADFQITIPKIENINNLHIDFQRLIYAKMGISDAEIETMTERTLSQGLKQCPKTSKMGVNGKVLFHFSINQMIWNKEVIPDMIRGFIRDFCLNNLDTNSPELFFFFSIEFDEDKKDLILREVSEALECAEFLRSMDELTMVSKDDIEFWFLQYGIFWEGTRNRKKVMSEYFGNPIADKMYMEDVQIELEKIIDKINGNEKHNH